MLVGLACAAGIASFGGRIVSYDDNVFANVQQYAATSIPPYSVVIADEAIGDLIGQPYCREQDTVPCAGVATYAITWDTYLQTTWDLGDSAYHKTVAAARCGCAVLDRFQRNCDRLDAPPVKPTSRSPASDTRGPVPQFWTAGGEGRHHDLLEQDKQQTIWRLRR